MATTTVKAYGATAATEDLKPLDIQRRAVGKDDVKNTYIVVFAIVIFILHNEWHGSTYPVVPGHEIVGRVLEVDNVSSYKAGDLVE
jgi:uncharacterized zinc-type alcohol dehydrogenase-like protein